MAVQVTFKKTSGEWVSGFAVGGGVIPVLTDDGWRTETGIIVEDLGGKMLTVPIDDVKLKDNNSSE